ncbi:MAG: hypothetical protein CMP22_07910 [Rickettsiales bacterium]|nr:hypothetical protein [Rickettsiales bacterium]|tara:strand:+ start:452 stop:661 length:210 start_codon:yes stop_codon:yes gene_type:complete
MSYLNYIKWAVIFLGRLLPFLFAYFQGKESQKKAELEDELESIEQARIIRDRIDNDDDARKRVQDHFRG